MLATLRSLPDPTALASHLAPRYDLDFTSCTLHRTLVNDVYHLSEILWETGLSAHLRSAGTLVPKVID
ncbi:hypothetical protein AB0E69_02400 [Kribbella sp. NPDC026611]|uniref:hypothetical protein n=1 Tax=Kribbella sp. NPDC026611 TaxID=3154911 RepID=UPI0033DCD2F0